MKRERVASALSVALLVAVAGWFVMNFASLPVAETRPAKPVIAASTGEPAPTVMKPAAAVIYLPPPPALQKPASRQLQKPANAAPPIMPLEPVKAEVSPLALRPLVPKKKAEHKPVKKTVAPERQQEQRAAAVAPAPLETAEPERETEAAREATLEPNREALREGRALLRVLEHGAGPVIEIAWPEDGASRDHLYHRFKGCFGMRTALMRGDGKLFTAEGPRGMPWPINLDRFSGFVRQPVGRLVADETLGVRRIRDHHAGLREASRVRVFPRRIDAILLSGLKRIAGQAYEKGEVIRARYRLLLNEVVVTDVKVGGVAVPGQIELPPVTRRCRVGL